LSLWFKLTVLAVLIAVTVAAYFLSGSGLPEFVDLKAYGPKTVSVFYAGNGSILGMVGTQRRLPVTLDAVPKHVQDAFVAALCAG
jgi:penicillin-binding protein 1A